MPGAGPELTCFALLRCGVAADSPLLGACYKHAMLTIGRIVAAQPRLLLTASSLS